jgi:hypothetical protein
VIAWGPEPSVPTTQTSSCARKERNVSKRLPVRQ